VVATALLCAGLLIAAQTAWGSLLGDAAGIGDPALPSWTGYLKASSPRYILVQVITNGSFDSMRHFLASS
jgi:hypothetical protein